MWNCTGSDGSAPSAHTFSTWLDEARLLATAATATTGAAPSPHTSVQDHDEPPFAAIVLPSVAATAASAATSTASTTHTADAETTPPETLLHLWQHVDHIFMELTGRRLGTTPTSALTETTATLSQQSPQKRRE
ncbi:MAG: hypothetical protein EOO65_03990 [Methanosarcinales archaeon]|nr:MAG: hypothetical protein EOO65_03990 [Methanosarcinales archaeon]